MNVIFKNRKKKKTHRNSQIHRSKTLKSIINEKQSVRSNILFDILSKR